MAMGEQSLGLCSTCNNIATCSRRKSLKGPVLFCEEFDDSTPPPANRAKVSPLSEEQAAINPAMGLCCNCANRDTCTLCRSPGGVWHCEQYC